MLDNGIFCYIILIEIEFHFRSKIFQMKTNTATKFSPIVSDKQKVELSLQNDKAVIKLSTWTENLGWCCQKTLPLDVEMLDDLHRVISAARYNLKKQNAEIEEISEKTNIISFPNVS